ncbi:hypothetical protein BX616_004271 [Lobosporangium transversale]|uniref:Major facilitator superfamily domain-containing protein n=1 Tax=Lobosporangium transversale TaxID=64571 RepID=A0A1Y2GGN4_9FUNG|nr:major facilitator superfamily domain-containing protein [Lobosporangium transversale]KAF9898262.1 hypothetical protein BX616_004271 [Lobosporangium transversale]ORZ09317.1 major facilitator superfamily domain-containing protein [Lobosporangium transversale]|eukprot:XP_021878770.1 major facilitator superfamily domain-containing protein [Lobosporangium transversale]
MTSKLDYKQEVDEQVPASASTSVTMPVNEKKDAYDQSEDISSIATSEATPGSAPVQLYHKPPTRQFVLILIALSLCVFLASLDQIIVSTSIPAITREYNSLNDISWLGTAYMMTSTAFQPLYGKFSDIFGRKTTMLFANIVFLVGSAISGWATSMAMLIIGRGISGIGAGGLMAMVFVILSDMLDMRERGKYIGFIGGIFSFSSVIGPLMGGAFTDHLTWRWSFWINLPVGAISILFIFFNLDLPTPPGSFTDKLTRIDYYGSLLLMGAVILILLPLSWGGNEYEWSSGIIIGMLVAGFVVAGIFIIVEWKVPKEPIVPIHLFKLRNLWSTYSSVFFSGMSFFGILFYLPVYFQVVKNESATVGGLETVPFAIGIVLTSISSGIWVLKRGTYAFFPAVGGIIFLAGSALCLLFEKDTPRVAHVFILFICGMGMGLSMQACTLAVQAAVKPKYMATVTTCIQFMRTLGQVFGVAIVGSVFNNKLHEKLLNAFNGDKTVLRVTLDYSQIYTYTNDKIDLIFESFISALHYVYYCCIAFCVLAFVMACFIQHKELKTNANQKPQVEMTVEMA